MSVDIHELFRRQRRNLNLYAVFVALFGVSKPHSEVNILGNSFSVDPLLLMLGVYSILIYFIWRYWGYFQLIDYGELTNRLLIPLSSDLRKIAYRKAKEFIDESDSLVKPILHDWIISAEPRKPFFEAYSAPALGVFSYRVNVNFDTVLSAASTEKGSAAHDMIVAAVSPISEILISFKEIRPFVIREFIKLSLFREWFSEYIFPLLVSFISFFTIIYYWGRLIDIS